MNIFRTIVFWVLAVIGIVCIVIPLVGWWNEPTLTQMQIFKNYWQYHLAACACAVTCGMLVSR